MIYYDTTGAVHWAQDPPLEPPDCWREKLGEPEEEEYDRAENKGRRA